VKFLFFICISAGVLFTGCVNRHGISMKYYSDCKEYYDLQGFYHKECGEDDMVTYKQMKEMVQEPKQKNTTIQGKAGHL